MKKTVTQNGLFYGLGCILIYMIAHLIDPSLNLSWKVAILSSFIIPVFCMVRGARQERDLYEGTITFGEVFSTVFPIFVIGTLLFTIMQAIHINIDEAYKAFLDTEILESAKESLKSMNRFLIKLGTEGLSPEQMQEQINNLNENPPKTSNITIFLGFLSSLIFPGAILSLIISLIMKKR